MASWTVRIFSASSSLILTLNSSSSDMISSTRSSESAFRSSMKFASGVTSSSLTLNCSAEDAIHKLCRGLAAEKLGQLNRLVDGGPERHCSIAVQGFIEADAQHVAVDRRHLRQRPQRRALLDQAIDGRAVLEHAGDQL